MVLSRSFLIMLRADIGEVLRWIIRLVIASTTPNRRVIAIPGRQCVVGKL